LADIETEENFLFHEMCQYDKNQRLLHVYIAGFGYCFITSNLHLFVLTAKGVLLYYIKPTSVRADCKRGIARTIALLILYQALKHGH
jgi:hypothetical protein